MRRIATVYKDGRFVSRSRNIWEVGMSRAEAIGQLIMSYPEAFGVYVDFIEPEEVPDASPDPEKKWVEKWTEEGGDS